MKQLKLNVQIVILGLLFLFCFPIISHGADVPISVRPILPDNQITGESGFFDLRMEPGQKQTLALEVSNNGEKAVTIHTEVVPASTASSGTVVYSSENNDSIDESNKFPMSTIGKTQGDVTIAAKEKANVDVEVTMPTEEISGVLLGGVRISILDEAKEETKKGEQGFSIDNEYAYVIAIQMSQKDDTPKPDMKILKIFPDQVAGRNTLMVNLQNPTNVLIGGLEYDAKVYKNGSQDVLHQSTFKDYQFAPTSNFNLPISWENKPFQAGTYTLKLNANSARPEGSWQMEQEFTISEKQAKALNEKAVELDKDYTLYIVLGVIGAILLLILIIILIVVLRKRKKKKQRRKRQNDRKGKKSGTNNRSTNSRQPNGESKRRRNNQANKGKPKPKRPTGNGANRK